MIQKLPDRFPVASMHSALSLSNRKEFLGKSLVEIRNRLSAPSHPASKIGQQP
jgi:hypothetical protein